MSVHPVKHFDEKARGKSRHNLVAAHAAGLALA
jgi:hypothetical protein